MQRVTNGPKHKLWRIYFVMVLLELPQSLSLLPHTLENSCCQQEKVLRKYLAGLFYPLNRTLGGRDIIKVFSRINSGQKKICVICYPHYMTYLKFMSYMTYHKWHMTKYHLSIWVSKLPLGPLQSNLQIQSGQTFILIS